MPDLFSSKVDTRELAYYPNISRLLQAFRYDFQVTWFSTERSHGTEFQFILLKPHETIKETFGLKSEIPVCFLRFRELQQRTAQAIEAVCRDSRFAGRIDATVALLCSSHDSVREWCAEYVSQNIQSRVLIALTDKILELGIDDRWCVINQLKEQFFIRDFFNYKQPIQSDTFFYGREITVNAILDDIKKVQNAGLFGLRKTGKTTVLLRVERLFKRANLGVAVKIDCQNRPIRKSDADGVATRVIQAIDHFYGKSFFGRISLDRDIMEVLHDAVRSVPKKHRVCIVFDEIEYITPLSPTDLQWNTEYIDLFQSLRAI